LLGIWLRDFLGGYQEIWMDFFHFPSSFATSSLLLLKGWKI